MKTTSTGIRLQFNENGTPELILTCPNRSDLNEVSDLKNLISQGKKLTVEIKQYRKKRSLDSNAYMWLLLGEMATVLKTTKDELYLLVLERYGVFTHVIVKPEVVDKVKQEWRTVRELGEVLVNGKTGIQLQCFFGSSTYDTKEMAKLIDGVVSEAKEVGIETLTLEELSILKNEWGNDISIKQS